MPARTSPRLLVPGPDGRLIELREACGWERFLSWEEEGAPRPTREETWAVRVFLPVREGDGPELPLAWIERSRDEFECPPARWIRREVRWVGPWASSPPSKDVGLDDLHAFLMRLAPVRAVVEVLGEEPGPARDPQSRWVAVDPETAGLADLDARFAGLAARVRDACGWDLPIGRVRAAARQDLLLYDSAGLDLLQSERWRVLAPTRHPYGSLWLVAEWATIEGAAWGPIRAWLTPRPAELEALGSPVGGLPPLCTWEPTGSGS